MRQKFSKDWLKIRDYRIRIAKGMVIGEAVSFPEFPILVWADSRLLMADSLTASHTLPYPEFRQPLDCHRDRR